MHRESRGVGWWGVTAVLLSFTKSWESQEMVSERFKFECRVKELHKPYFSLFGWLVAFQ